MARFKNRYITIEVVTEKGGKLISALNKKELTRQVLSTVSFLYGDFGIASVRSGFAANYCNENTKIAILRVRHGPHKFVSSALPCISSIGGVSVKINTIFIGATLLHCYKRIMRHQKAALVKYLNEAIPEEKLKLEKEILTIRGMLAKKRRDK